MGIRYVFACFLLLAAACGSSAGPAASTTPSPTGVNVVAEVGKTVKGQDEIVLTNVSAQTLYYLTADTSTTVACKGQCTTFWPPLLLPAGEPSSTVTLPGKLTVASNANGMQVLYNGHPLYAFVKDKTSNDANGEGVNAFGGTWHAATPDMPAA
jgi:predicted lipoprotein with Yx(FWY)xxD motif